MVSTMVDRPLLDLLHRVILSGSSDLIPASPLELSAMAAEDDLWSQRARAVGGTAADRRTCVAASAAGVPTVTPEIGNDGRLDPQAVARCHEVIMNVMAAMG